jgi:DNA-binding NtrC family response regulator
MTGKISSPPRVLIADDQSDVLDALKLLLKPEGYVTDAVSSPAEVLEAVSATTYDVALIDLNYSRDTTSGAEGLELVERLRAVDGELPVIVMTAWGSVQVAVEAIQRGASDFVQKPWENDRLLTILRTQVELARALRRGRRLEAENRLLRAEGHVELIAASRVMQPVLAMIDRIGPSDANVLITGEHGTGKDVVARALHSVSPRADKSLVTVNLGGLSEGVFASELFGHIKGAFTDARADRVGRFEMADHGTLFLDEIANVPLAEQAKLLRVIETGELERVGESRTRRVEVRILSATNADLNAEVSAGRFREDLLFRLNTIYIHLPPLRERAEDIPVLANHFLGRFAARYRKSLTGFDGAAGRAIARHPWPGNVRELAHVVERAVLMAAEEEIAAADLGLAEPEERRATLEELTLEEVEKILMRKALRKHGGNVSRAAEALGISRSAFYRRLQKHGL